MTLGIAQVADPGSKLGEPVSNGAVTETDSGQIKAADQNLARQLAAGYMPRDGLKT